jgi:hypothetical protein
VANVCTTAATGTAERDAAQWLLTASAPPHSTVGGDKNFDVPAFVAAVRDLQITPHVAQKAKGTAIDARHDASRGVCHQSTETETDRASLRVDENRGAGCGSCSIGAASSVDWMVTFTAAAYNLIRLRTLLARAT